MEKLDEFLSVSSGYGYGYGSGSGYGYGYGSGYGSYGYGYGYGSGSGYGYGYGDGAGYGSGDGAGYGDGSGYGDGAGYGSGYGYGYGDGISKYNGSIVSIIDGIPTIIDRIYKGTSAKGRILNNDLTTTKCWVVKGNNMFAHGETLKDACKALEEKILENMDVDKKIAEFRKHFQEDKAYPTKDFYEWHHILTGSCEMGRKQFATEHNIDLNGTMTLQEFVNLTKNAYGGDVIRRLKEQI